MEFYHIDRSGQLHVGEEVRLQPISPDLIKYPLLNNYPDGVSNHGLNYLNRTNDIWFEFNDTSSSIIESFFELIRMKFFPNKFSRFQSFFAFETMSDFIKWKSIAKNNPTAKILKIQIDHNNYFKFDSCFLDSTLKMVSFVKNQKPLFSFDFKKCYDNAFDYWSGKVSPHPIFEILILPPIKVIEIIPWVE